MGNNKNTVVASNVTSTFVYPFLDPKQEIAGWAGLIKASEDLLGPNIVGPLYNPQFLNIRTAKTMEKGHHCSGGGENHARSRRCLDLGHFYYCVEWETVDGHRVRCNTGFKIDSGGCGKHPTNLSSQNRLICELSQGKIETISWADLNDPERQADYDTKEQNEANAAKEELMEENERENFIREGRYEEASVQPHVRFEEKKLADRLTRKTKAREAAKLDQLTQESMAKLDKKSLKAMEKDRELYDREFQTKRNLIQASLAAEAAANTAPPKDARLAELDAKRSKLSEGMKSNARDRKWNNPLSKKKKLGSNDENQPPM